MLELDEGLHVSRLVMSAITTHQDTQRSSSPAITAVTAAAFPRPALAPAAPWMNSGDVEALREASKSFSFSRKCTSVRFATNDCLKQ